MKPSICAFCPIFLVLWFFTLTLSATAQTNDILTGSKLSPGFDMGVNSSEGRANWLKGDNGQLRLSYPLGQSWGAVFITVGKPKQPPRPFKDFSAFESLIIDIRGESGGEQLEIGIKTNDMPDDGSETKIPIRITSQWQTYTFKLDKFSGIDLKKLYVVTEFVFSDNHAQTVYVRSIKYLARNSPTGTGTTSGAEGSLLPKPETSNAPQVTISSPAELTEISSWSGDRPSLMVAGSADTIPPGTKLFLVVHPTHSDNVWANEISLTGRNWVSQAYLGGAGGLPRDGDTFQIFTTVRPSDQPLPPMFNMKDEVMSNPSSIITIKVKLISWLDRLIAFGKDWQVSIPIGTVFGVFGFFIQFMFGSSVEARRRTSSTKPGSTKSHKSKPPIPTP